MFALTLNALIISEGDKLFDDGDDFANGRKGLSRSFPEFLESKTSKVDTNEDKHIDTNNSNIELAISGDN